jgi:hypothetical protein
MQIDKYTLNDMLILNPQSLSDKEKQNLFELFERIKSQEFPDILHQLNSRFSARVKLDYAIMMVLGFGDDEIDRILNYLYPALAKEIEQLKTLMQG